MRAYEKHKRRIFSALHVFLGVLLLFPWAGKNTASPQNILSQDTTLQDVRFSVSPEKVRLVLDVTSVPSLKAVSGANTLSVTLYNTSYSMKWESNELLVQDNSVQKISAQADTQKKNTILTIYLARSLPYRVFRLNNPGRIVVDIYKSYEDKTVLFLQPSAEFYHVRKSTDAGILSYYVLRLDMSSDALTLKPSLAGQIFSREKLSGIVNAAEAFAGVNGGFFSKEGKPLGLVALEGQVYSENLYHRSCFVEKKSGGFVVENMDVEISAEVEGGKSLAIDGLNRERKENEIVVYTSSFGDATKTNIWGKEFAVVDGVVHENSVDASGSNNSVIPQNGFVLSAASKRVEELASSGVAEGKKLKLVFHVKPDIDFQNILCAGPRLLKDGKLYVMAKEEQFKKDITEGKAPRTAVGITKEGDVILLVVDGRNSQVSNGVTLDELAELMLGLGGYNAVNFDGGGSSTMAIGGTVVNSPSDGTERKIASALLVMLNATLKGAGNDAVKFSEMFMREGEGFSIPLFSEAH